jgi:hypothetical protein
MPPTLLLRTTYARGEEADGVFDAEQKAFLETGCALIVGTALPDGLPHAARGWGLSVLPSPGQVRLLLALGDSTTVERVAAGARIAVTATSVRTLRSLQLKGTARSVEPATTEDRARADRYCDDFFTDIAETDGVDRAITERIVPASYLACTIVVDQLFDQTPGPGAGARLHSAAS